MAAFLDPRELVDLERYPIVDLEDSVARALIKRCRVELKAEGASNLDGFIRPEAIAALVREAEALRPVARVKKGGSRNIFVKPVDESWPSDHPGRIMMAQSGSAQIAYDQIPADAGIRRLFEWDPLTNFVAAALGKPKLYRFADPFQAANLIYLDEGGGSPWHFDHNDSTVTLLLQEPEAGGAFEYVPFLRSSDNPNHEGIRRLINGDRSGVRSPERHDGTLTLFLGEFSAHRVAPVEGARARITAIFTYDEQPGRESTDEANILVYGPRAAEIIARRRAGKGATNRMIEVR